MATKVIYKKERTATGEIKDSKESKEVLVTTAGATKPPLLRSKILKAPALTPIHTNNDTSSAGYCHELKLKVNRDGVVTIVTTDEQGRTTESTDFPITLGNQGDSEITRLTFDISDLNGLVDFPQEDPGEGPGYPREAPREDLGEELDSPREDPGEELDSPREDPGEDPGFPPEGPEEKGLDEYLHVLFFNFGESIINPNIPESDDDKTYLPYELTSNFDYTEDTISLPFEMLQKEGTFSRIFGLLEINSDGGNNPEEREVFISKEFTGKVNKTDILALRTRPVNVMDSGEGLAKNDLTVTVSDDNYVIVNATDNSDSLGYGEKEDRYIKRLKLNETDGKIFNAGLKERIACFFDTNDPARQWVINMHPMREKYTWGCLLPAELTSVPGNYKIFIVGQTPDFDRTDSDSKSWVSNSLDYTVNDNFLDEDIKNITESMIITAEKGLQDSENYYIKDINNYNIDTIDENGRPSEEDPGAELRE